MIATHNIKVNGRWYHAGEELPGEPKKAKEPKQVAPEVAETPELVPQEPEEPKPEPKPRTTPRRKAAK